jgi:hypothetical protein
MFTRVHPCDSRTWGRTLSRRVKESILRSEPAIGAASLHRRQPAAPRLQTDQGI